MKSQIFFQSFLVGALSLQAVAADRPNILFIYTDDQSTRTVSCYEEAHSWVNTPHIDALAAAGIRFEHAYIGSWCMTSRASLLTGLQQHGIESMRMEGQYPGSTYDPKQCRFWPSVFRKNGYQTAHIGKWHTGTDDGFGRDWDYQIVWNRPKYVKNSPNYFDDQLIVKNGGEPKMTKGYTTDLYTDWAVDYIRGEGREEGKPWYLWLCYGAVHGPFTPAERHLDDYEDAVVEVPADIYPPRPDKPKYVREMEFWEPGKDGYPVERKVRENSPVGMQDMPGRSLRDWVQQYQQGVLAIDEGVGQLLKALQATGQDENTMIVFTSDQGFAWGQKGFKSKVAPYRANVEAPMIIRMPGAVAEQSAGRVIEEPIAGVDIVPTFFSQAGIKLPWEMHGYDLSPLLGAEDRAWEYPALLVHTAKQFGSDTNIVPPVGDPKLIHGPGIPWYVMLCEGEYKYIRNLIEGETEELYHMGEDPEELVNLAQLPAHQETLNEFRVQAIDELRRTKAGMVDNLPAVGTPVN